MDADGDDELSFSDFFTSLLPYFIYGDLKGQVQATKFSKRSKSKGQSSLHGNRVKSAAASRSKPQNYFSKNTQYNEDFEDDFLGENIQGLRNSQDLGASLKGLNFANA